MRYVYSVLDVVLALAVGLLVLSGCDEKPAPKPQLKTASLEISITEDANGGCRLNFIMKSDAKTPAEAIDLAILSLKVQAPAKPLPPVTPPPAVPPIKPEKQPDLPAGSIVPPGYNLPPTPPAEKPEEPEKP